MADRDDHGSKNEKERGRTFEKLVRTRLSELYELRPVPEEFLQIVQEFDRRVRGKN